MEQFCEGGLKDHEVEIDHHLWKMPTKAKVAKKRTQFLRRRRRRKIYWLKSKDDPFMQKIAGKWLFFSQSLERTRFHRG